MPDVLLSPPTHEAVDRSRNGSMDAEKTAENSDHLERARFFSKEYLVGPVKRNHSDLALLACSLVTGMVDAAAFMNWGSFVGAQTGNTIILGLSAAGLPANPHAWLNTIVSIASFLIGTFTTFRLVRLFAPEGAHSNRLVIVLLFFTQSLLILLSAALATPRGLIPQNPGSTSRTTLNPPDVIRNIRIVSLLPPLAFQAGMQIASSRLLGYNELPVNVLTSTYCDIMGDNDLFALNNIKRNRRVASVILVLAGAIVSGWLMRSAGGLMSVLWLAGGVKLLIAATILLFMPAAELLKRVSSLQ